MKKNSKLKTQNSKLIILFLLLSGFLYSVELVNVPTAETLKKGDLFVGFRIYDNGGVVMSSGFGISNNVLVGVPLDMENAIGDKNIELSLPLVLFLKVRLTGGNEKIPSISLGYNDPYGYKKRWMGKKIKGLKGLYLTATKPVILFNLPHSLNFGLLADVEDYKKGGLSLFAGTSLSLGDKFTLLAEIEGIPLDKGEEGNRTGFNLGAKFSLAQNLDLSICFIDLFGGGPSRIVKIGYETKIF